MQYGIYIWVLSNSLDLNYLIAWTSIFISIVLFFLHKLKYVVYHNIIVSNGSIEVKGLNYHKILNLNDIKGYKIIDKHIILFSKSSEKKRLSISRDLESYEKLYNFFTGNFTDLSQLNKEKELQKILNNTNYGRNPDEVNERFLFWKKVTKWSTYSVIFLGLWFVLYPYPYHWLFMLHLILPLFFLGYVFASRGMVSLSLIAYQKDEKTHDIPLRPNIGLAIYYTCNTLGLRLLVDYGFVSVNALWSLIGILPTIILSAFLYRVLFSKIEIKVLTRKKIIELLMLPVMIYLCVSIWLLSINRFFDYLPVKRYNVEVLGKNEIEYGYLLKVTPWYTRKQENEINVYEDTFKNRKVGDTVQVVVHPGVFNIPWYHVRYEKPK